MATVEIIDCFHRNWISSNIRAGRISKAFSQKNVLAKKDIEFELGTRDTDLLVTWFQYQIEEQYMLSWANSDYILDLYDRTYCLVGQTTVGYDWFRFTVDSENILSLNYADDIVAMLQTGEQVAHKDFDHE